MAVSLINEDTVRRAVAVAGEAPLAAVDRVERAGPGMWRAEAAGTPLLVAQTDNDTEAMGVVVFEVQRAGPSIPRRPAVAVLADGDVLPLTVASTYRPVWARLRAAPRRGNRPERVLAALAVRYIECQDVDTNQLLVADLADLADHLDSAQARKLGVTPLEFFAEPPTWTTWSYGLARSGIRPHRLDLLRWRISLDPAHAEIIVSDRRTDVPSTFYGS